MVPFVNLMKKIKNINMTEIRGMGDLSRLQVNEETLAEMQEMGSLAVKMASGLVEGTAGGALLAFGAFNAVGFWELLEQERLLLVLVAQRLLMRLWLP